MRQRGDGQWHQRVNKVGDITCKLLQIVRGARPPNVFDTILNLEIVFPMYLDRIYKEKKR